MRAGPGERQPGAELTEVAQVLEGLARGVGQQRETHDHEAGDGRIRQHHGAVDPVLAAGQFAAQVAPEVGFVVVHARGPQATSVPGSIERRHGPIVVPLDQQMLGQTPRTTQSVAASRASWSVATPQPTWKPIFSWAAQSSAFQCRARAV